MTTRVQEVPETRQILFEIPTKSQDGGGLDDPSGVFEGDKELTNREFLRLFAANVGGTVLFGPVVTQKAKDFNSRLGDTTRGEFSALSWLTGVTVTLPAYIHQSD